MKNYYELLGVSKESTTTHIKQQYRKLALKHHPDKNNGSSTSTEYFKQLSEAYTTLSNPKKRYFYDIQLQFRFLESFDLSDEELILLHTYYEKMKQSVEIRLLIKLCKSFPKDVTTYFTKRNTCYALSRISHLKYIDASQLQSDYSITLHRNVEDVYTNVLKEIILITTSNYYRLFITHSDYSIQIYNHTSSTIFITIKTIPSGVFYTQGTDLCYQHCINVYEYCYGSRFTITLPNQCRIHCIASDLEHKEKSIIPGYGIKNTNNQRGSLLILYKLTSTKIDPKYKQDLQHIFKPYDPSFPSQEIVFRV